MVHAASTRRRLVLRIRTALVTVLSVVAVESVAAQDVPALQRIRSENPRITEAIADGTARSVTFRRLVDIIDASDGLVYVMDGDCGHGVNACVLLSITIAGPFRVLRILVAPRKAPGCELVETIGHELQHAVEVLRELRIRNNSQMHHFFGGVGPTGFGRFETAAAINAGLDVAHEACQGR
jgi:hypothetical protein